MPARGVVPTALLSLALALPAMGLADDGPERVTVDIGGCEATLERRVVEPSVLVFRTECDATAASTARALDAALTARFPDGRIDGEIRAVSVGRIADLDWLSQSLAEAAARDQGWDVETGAPESGSPEAYVGALVTRDGLVAALAPPLARRGLQVTTATVEKVLVADTDGRRLPVDAQLWLRISSVARSSADAAK